MLPTGVPEYRVHTTPSLVEHWRHLVEIIALITAAVWAFYVFVYQERIKPALEPARLHVSTNLTHEALQGGKELVTIYVTIKNIGSIDASMAGLIVNAYGVKYKGGTSGGSRDIKPASGVTIVNNGLASDDPKLLYSHLALWPPFGASHGRRPLWVPQGEDISIADPLVIERGAYDTVRVTYAFCYQRNDDNAVSAYNPKRTPDGGFDVMDLLAASGAHAGLHCGGTPFYNGEYAL